MYGAAANGHQYGNDNLVRVERRRWREGPGPGRKSPLMDQLVPLWRTSEYFTARIEEQIYRGRREKRPFAVLWARIPAQTPQNVVSLLDLAYVMELIENDALRPDDLVCLLAPDELGVLIADSALENVEEIAEIVADCFEDEVRPKFGIALYPRHGESARELINRAKLGLPEQKQPTRVVEMEGFRRQKAQERLDS